ncbi:MAG: M16 family metallopeptidase [Cyanophyceae cyanobacterium]
MDRAFPNRAIAQSIGGTEAAVAALKIDDLRQHYRRFYRPDNAVLTIVGNFDQDQAFAMVRRLFGPIQSGDGETPLSLNDKYLGAAQLISRQIRNSQEAPSGMEPSMGEGTIANPLRLEGASPLVQMVYPMPEAGHQDEAPLLVLSRVLGAGRRSLLNQALVDGEEPLAGTVDGLLFHGVDQGWYQLVVEGLPEVSLETLQRRALGVVQQVRDGRVNQEGLERAKVLVRSQLLLDERDVTSQGMRLGQECLILADCGYRDRLLKGVETVTPADVQRVAQRYLGEDRVTVGWLEASDN